MRFVIAFALATASVVSISCGGTSVNPTAPSVSGPVLPTIILVERSAEGCVVGSPEILNFTAKVAEADASKVQWTVSNETALTEVTKVGNVLTFKCRVPGVTVSVKAVLGNASSSDFSFTISQGRVEPYMVPNGGRVIGTPDLAVAVGRTLFVNAGCKNEYEIYFSYKVVSSEGAPFTVAYFQGGAAGFFTIAAGSDVGSGNVTGSCNTPVETSTMTKKVSIYVPR